VPGRAHCAHDCEVPEADLFTPITIRDVKVCNRIAMSPMCSIPQNDGYAIYSLAPGQLFFGLFRE
jgi:NADH:flavin oxidoreductase / NADH oxidase family